MIFITARCDKDHFMLEVAVKSRYWQSGLWKSKGQPRRTEILNTVRSMPRMTATRFTVEISRSHQQFSMSEMG